MNIYVGNLTHSVTDSDLRALFERYGEVKSAVIIKDRETRQPRGFGFVEMSNNEAGKSAIAELNGAEFEGRVLKVNEARPREEMGPRPGGFQRREGGFNSGPRQGGGYGDRRQGGGYGDRRQGGGGYGDRRQGGGGGGGYRPRQNDDE